MSVKFRYVGNHSQDFPGGRVVDPGDFIQLSNDDQEDGFVKELMADGRLIGTGAKSKEAAREAEKEVAKNE